MIFFKKIALRKKVHGRVDSLLSEVEKSSIEERHLILFEATFIRNIDRIKSNFQTGNHEHELASIILNPERLSEAACINLYNAIEHELIKQINYYHNNNQAAINNIKQWGADKIFIELLEKRKHALFLSYGVLLAIIGVRFNPSKKHDVLKIWKLLTANPDNIKDSLDSLREDIISERGINHFVFACIIEAMQDSPGIVPKSKNI